MKSLLSSVLTLVLVCGVSGCKKDFSCENLKKGEWAIEFPADLGVDGDCPYEGIAVLDGEEHEVLCEVSGEECLCNAGHEFGIYDVTFTNTETGETRTARIEVEVAPEPICLLRDRVDDYDLPPGGGGAGGVGGADN